MNNYQDQHYKEEKAEYIEQKLEEYTKHTYLPAHNRAVLRDVLGREYDTEMANMVRVDSHTGHDDQ